MWSLIGLLSLALTCLLAWTRGGYAERGGSAAFGAAWVVAVLIPPLVSRSLVVPLNLCCDAAVALAFLVLAVRYSSWWLGVAMIVQAAEFMINASFLNEEHQDLYGYVLRTNVVSFAILFSIVSGTIASWRSRLRAGRAGSNAEPPKLKPPASSPLLPPGAPSC